MMRDCIQQNWIKIQPFTRKMQSMQHVLQKKLNQNKLIIFSLPLKEVKEKMIQKKFTVLSFDLNQNNNQKDRKSTRLNSSHVKISYAVFCLKKKKKTK